MNSILLNLHAEIEGRVNSAGVIFHFDTNYSLELIEMV